MLRALGFRSSEPDDQRFAVSGLVQPTLPAEVLDPFDQFMRGGREPAAPAVVSGFALDVPERVVAWVTSLSITAQANEVINILSQAGVGAEAGFATLLPSPGVSSTRSLPRCTLRRGQSTTFPTQGTYRLITGFAGFTEWAADPQPIVGPQTLVVLPSNLNVARDFSIQWTEFKDES